MSACDFIAGKVSRVAVCLGVLAMLLCVLSSTAHTARAADVSQLAINTHVLATDDDGNVYGWGFNSSYQVGDGTNSTRSLPVQLTTISGARGATAGVRHSVVLKKDGTLVAWGDGSKGQLGNGSMVSSSEPVNVLNLSEVIAIASGDGASHTLALRGDGTVWAWGDNGYGQLGNGTTVESSIPIQVSGLTEVISVAVGENYSLALKGDGTVWAWGSNNYSRLGQGDAIESYVPVPVRTSSGFLTGVTAIAAGSYHCLALKANGDLWGWGDNHQYELGDATTGLATVASVATPITTVSGLVKIAAGYQFSMGVKADGSVWSWGSDEYGKLGDGVNNDEANVLDPVEVLGVRSPSAIVAGGPTAAAIMDDGTIRMWGYGFEGQLGVGVSSSASFYVVTASPDGNGNLVLNKDMSYLVPIRTMLLED